MQMHHHRKQALKEADLVLLAGVPCDFRLGYGKHIGYSATVVSASMNKKELTLNCRPKIAIECDPSLLLVSLAETKKTKPDWTQWIEQLRQRDIKRQQEIQEQGEIEIKDINPIRLFNELNQLKDDNSVFVADGGDFVATASYLLEPPGPLSWLDPGPYGTLGVGAGFALSVKLCHPDKDVWVLFGDGAFGYSLAEFDTFCRHGIPVIGLVGNDACWSQVARDQIDIFNDDVATRLTYTHYERIVEDFGGVGLLLDDSSSIQEVLQKARNLSRDGRPVLINAILSKSEFRKGSISI